MRASPRTQLPSTNQNPQMLGEGQSEINDRDAKLLAQVEVAAATGKVWVDTYTYMDSQSSATR